MTATNMTTAYIATPERDRLTVLVLTPASSEPAEVLHLEVIRDGDPQEVPVAKVAIAGWAHTGPLSGSIARRWHRARGTLGDIPEIRYSKTVIDGLDAGTAYRVAVKQGETPIADCVGTTLPGPETRSAQFIFGSCHGVSADKVKAGFRASFLGSAHGRLRAGNRRPLYQLWLGDQLYVDDPWKHGWKLTVDPHREIITRYRVALGLTPHPSALPALFAHGSNHFIPDDHEFWNNYPRASMATLPVHHRLAGDGSGKAVLLQPVREAPPVSPRGLGANRRRRLHGVSVRRPERVLGVRPVGVAERGANHRFRWRNRRHGRHPLASDHVAARRHRQGPLPEQGGLRGSREDPRA